MKRVLTYGTFDLLHYGHIEFLRRAKMMGDYLIVGVSNDKFNSEKGKKSYYDFNLRKRIVESIRYVDLVIEQKSFEQKEQDILDYKADILVSSSDWKGKFDHLDKYVDVIYLDREPEISTTKVKNDLKIYDLNN